jgi:uncharacterized Zn-binding protein involved in type VI secretion
MIALPIACQGDVTDIPGVPGDLVGPVGSITSVSPTVTAMGRPVLTVGATIAPHGNYYDPESYGYNPLCASSTVQLRTSTTVFVNGKPLAVADPVKGSVCSCAHIVAGPGAPNVLVGGV